MDSGCLCLLNWWSQPEIFSCIYQRSKQAKHFYCRRGLLVCSSTIIWAKQSVLGEKKGDWFTYTQLSTSAAALAVNDISALQGGCQAIAEMASVFFGDPILTYSFGPNLHHEDSEELRAKLTPTSLCLVRALWGQFSQKISEKTDRRKWLVKKNIPETFQFNTSSAGWHQ